MWVLIATKEFKMEIGRYTISCSVRLYHSLLHWQIMTIMAYPLKFLFEGNMSSYVMPVLITYAKFSIRGSIKNNFCEEKVSGGSFLEVGRDFPDIYI